MKMKVKKLLSLMLALLLVVAMFAGCGKTETPTTPTTPTTPDAGTTDTPSTGGDAPVEDSPYNFAAGNFEKITELCLQARKNAFGD